MIEIAKKQDFKAAKELLQKEQHEVIIKKGIKKIENRAFCYCDGLVSVTIPDSVIKIGKEAFHGCRNLTSVVIPNSVTEIDAYAFARCSALTSITIPDSVNTIGSDAFGNCNKLEKVVLPDSEIEVSNMAFYGCKNLKEVMMPESLIKVFAFTGYKGYVKQFKYPFDKAEYPNLTLRIYGRENNDEIVDDKRNLALAFDWLLRREYVDLVETQGSYGEISDDKWLTHLDDAYHDRYHFIAKQTIKDMGYWVGNHYFFNKYVNDVLSGDVQAVTDDQINGFYEYCADNQITEKDLIRFLLLKSMEADDTSFAESNTEEIKEKIEGILIPLGLTFSKDFIEHEFIPAYRAL